MKMLTIYKIIYSALLSFSSRLRLKHLPSLTAIRAICGPDERVRGCTYTQ